MTGFWIFLGLGWLGFCLDAGLTNIANQIRRGLYEGGNQVAHGLAALKKGVK